MAENKLLDLSFEFAVAIVNLVDDVTAPKSSSSVYAKMIIRGN